MVRRAKMIARDRLPYATQPYPRLGRLHREPRVVADLDLMVPPDSFAVVPARPPLPPRASPRYVFSHLRRATPRLTRRPELHEHLSVVLRGSTCPLYLRSSSTCAASTKRNLVLTAVALRILRFNQNLASRSRGCYLQLEVSICWNNCFTAPSMNCRTWFSFSANQVDVAAQQLGSQT